MYVWIHVAKNCVYLKAHTTKQKYMYAHTHVHIRSEVMDTLT